MNHQGLFDLVAQWNDGWESWLTFDAKLSDPNRFLNRGGALLSEEREFRRLERKLPHIEEKLAKECEHFLQEFGREFTIGEETFPVYIKRVRSDYHEEKENARLEKVIIYIINSRH